MKPAARMRLPHETVVRPAKTKGTPHIGPQLQGKPSIRGSRHPRATITEGTVERVWELKAEYPTWGAKRIAAALAREGVEVRERTITNILRRQAWAWMAPEET